MATGRKHMQRERLSEGTRKRCDSPTHTTKGVEVNRNDSSTSAGYNKPGFGILRAAPFTKGNVSLTICGFKTSDQPEFKEVKYVNAI